LILNDYFSNNKSNIDAKGNDIPDTYFAALAIESNCVWISMDKGFKRFQGLEWRSL
jgi:predicted nucleic acid-binding protein